MLDSIVTIVMAIIAMYFISCVVLFIFEEIVNKYNDSKIEINKKTEQIITFVLTGVIFLIVLFCDL